MTLNQFLTIASLLLLVGCGATPVADDDFKPTPVTFTITVPYDCGTPPPVSGVTMRDVEWDIVEIDGVDYFTLTVGDYQALGLNLLDWLASTKQLLAQRDFYRDCIARSKAEHAAQE